MNSAPTSPRKRGSAGTQLAAGEYTIDQLAQASETTVRNIRAYQDKGVLPPPEKRGRLGVYQDSHIGRLKLINNLLDRGFSVSNINELLGAWQQGRELADVLGLEHALTSVFSGEHSRVYSLRELLSMFGISSVRKDLIEEAIKLDLIHRKGTKLIAKSPSLLEAGAEMVKLGMPFEDILGLVRLLRGNVQRAADGLVATAVKQFDTFDGELPSGDAAKELSELVWKIRPIAYTAIRAEAEQALNRSLQNFLGDRLGQVLEHMQTRNPS